MRVRGGRSSSTTSSSILSGRSVAGAIAPVPSSARARFRRRLPAVGPRENDRDDGAPSQARTPDLDGSSVLLHDALAYGEAEARSLPHLLSREEGIEDLRQILRGDPDAI